jgi:hypothetical protein
VGRYLALLSEVEVEVYSRLGCGWDTRMIIKCGLRFFRVAGNAEIPSLIRDLTNLTHMAQVASIALTSQLITGVMSSIVSHCPGYGLYMIPWPVVMASVHLLLA